MTFDLAIPSQLMAALGPDLVLMGGAMCSCYTRRGVRKARSTSGA